MAGMQTGSCLGLKAGTEEVKPDLELLLAECEFRGLPLRYLDAATPEELACLLCEAERLDKATLEDLRAECHMHGFAAAGTRTAWGEPAELAEVLINVFIWKRLDLPGLQKVCRERNLAVLGTEQHSALLERLAWAAWEEQGLLFGARPFKTLQAAQELLDGFRSLEGMTLVQLRDRCRHECVPFTRVTGKGELIGFLRLFMTWSHLPLAFLQRTCSKRNIRLKKLSGSLTLHEELLLSLLVESLQADVLETYGLPLYVLKDRAIVRSLYIELQELDGMERRELADFWSMTMKSVADGHSLPCPDQKGMIRCLLLLHAWRSLMSMEQLRRLCLEEGAVMRAERVIGLAGMHTKSSLVACLFEQTFSMEWETVGIPVRRLGYKATAALLGRRAEIRTLGLQRLKQLYCSAGLPMERQLERRAFVNCLQWLEVEKALIRLDRYTALTPASMAMLSNSICKARGFPESRLGGNFPSVVKLARRYDAIACMGAEELHREGCRLGLLQRANTKPNNLRHWLIFHALLHALTWDELIFECLDRGLDPEENLQWWGLSWFSTRQYLEMRKALERQCLLHECLSSLEAKGLPALKIGIIDSAVALSNRLEELESMADEQLKDNYQALGLPREEGLDRQSRLAVLQQWEVWKALPLAELEEECLSRDMRQVPRPSCRARLQEWLLMDLSECGFARRGIPVKQLASLGDATELAHHFSSLEALDASSLAEHCRQWGLPLVGNPERDGLLLRLKELAKWDAFSDEGLRAECRHKDFPQWDLRLANRPQLRDMLLLDLCQADFEQKGISVAILGSFAACSSLANELDRIEAMTDDELWKQYGALGLLTVGLSRPTIMKRLQDVARWTAWPLAELQAACRAYRLNTIAKDDTQGKSALAKRIAGAMWKKSRDLDPFPEELPAEPPSKMDLQYLQRKLGVSLPEEGLAWSWWEVLLFFQSAGHLRPGQLAARRKARHNPGNRISVAVITSEARHHLHWQVWRCFLQQTWPDKELVVVDTWVRGPSPFFSGIDDPRLVYVSIQVPHSQFYSLGFKRNVCTYLASGKYIAHFDDDDIYAPLYLKTMLEEMCRQGWDAITLRSWYIYESTTGRFGHVEPRVTVAADDPDGLDGAEYGYGFSYMYTREIATRIPYSDVSFNAESGLCEDWPFFERIRKSTQRELGLLDQPVFMQGLRAGIPGPEGVALLADDFGICLHVMHSKNLAQSFAHRRVPAEEAEALEVRELECFEAMLQGYTPCPSTAANQSLIPDLRESRSQVVLVRSAEREWQVSLPAGSRVGSLRLAVHRILQDSLSTEGLKDHFDFYLNCSVALCDQERLPLRVKELWVA